MRVAGVRFDPPEARWSSELRWVLDRAFAAPETAVSPLEHPRQALRAARRLGLAARIAARTPAPRLVAELGPRPARKLATERLSSRARTAPLIVLLEELTDLATTCGCPFVPLKFAALHGAGCLTPDSRPAGDVDVLVKQADAAEWERRLRERGFERRSHAVGDHQLPTLEDPQGRCLELHVFLPGVRIPGQRRFARFEPLERAGLLAPGACRAPAPELLAAHLMAHGLAQEGWLPRRYPLLRTVADLADLKPGRCEDLAAPAGALLVGSLSRAEVEGMTSLAGMLSRRELGRADTEGEPSRPLLHHAIAAAEDDAYCRSLELRHLLDPLTDGLRAIAVARQLRDFAFPGAQQLAVLYGPARSPMGRLGQRLRRLREIGLRLFGRRR